MKKRIAVIVLSVLLVVSIGWGVIATGVSVTGLRENQKFADSNEALIEQVNELNSQLIEQKFDAAIEAATEVPVVLTAIGNVISEGATTLKVNDNTIMIVAPYYNGIVEEVKGVVSMIPSALNTAEYKSCIIIVVDGNNDCQYGWTIHSDGSSTAFIGE